MRVSDAARELIQSILAGPTASSQGSDPAWDFRWGCQQSSRSEGMLKRKRGRLVRFAHLLPIY